VKKKYNSPILHKRLEEKILLRRRNSAPGKSVVEGDFFYVWAIFLPTSPFKGKFF
jgi:hypothetical protein